MTPIEYSEETAYRLYLSFETMEGLVKDMDGNHPVDELSSLRQFMVENPSEASPINPEDMRTVFDKEDIGIMKENINNVISSVRGNEELSQETCTVVKIASRCIGMLSSVYEKETGECWI